MKTQEKTILVAPLNWGLGHSTRCIPIIRNLEHCGFTPIIASDGEALRLLKFEFPHLRFLELPSYGIIYPKNGKYFRWKLLQNVPKIFLAIRKEQKLIKIWVKQYALCGIISDNRLGILHKTVPSVYITHQLNVLSGFTTYFSSKIHQQKIQKFRECWVPDVLDRQNLSGKLGHREKVDVKVKYIGPLSRFRKLDSEIKFDLAVLLSGPEPQRSLLEEKLILQLKNYNGKVLFVKGLIAEKQEISKIGTILFYNFMTSSDLEIALNESEIMLCRSGYTSIMDLAKLEKKAFFIPTPGQFEQEYLAKKFKEEGLVPSCSQDEFTIEKLDEVEYYKGLFNFTEAVDWHKLFRLFDGK